MGTKETLNYIELQALVRELQIIIGARVDKIYHPSENEVLIQLYSPKLKKATLKIVIPNIIVLTDYKIEHPTQPSHFCMFLRKYLNNARITQINQPKFERIIEITFSRDSEQIIMVIEFFSKGNIILCDKEKRILIPLKSQVWKDRVIKSKEIYAYPPSGINLETLQFSTFKELILSSEKDQIVKAIATVLGVGGTYAEELCLKSKIEKTKSPKLLSDTELRIIFKNFNDFLEFAKEGKITPYIVYEGNVAIDVQPFELQIYKDFKKEYFNSFNDAVDEFFIKRTAQSLKTITTKSVEEEILKQEELLKQHKSYLEEVKSKAAQYKQKADLIYHNFSTIQEIVNLILQARENRTPWKEIIEKIEQGKKQGNQTALLIKDINPNTGIITFNINSGIDIDITKSITDNASDYYEQAKKLQAKIDGILQTINTIENKIDELKKRKENISQIVTKKLPKPIEKKETQWYEKFIWMITSGGKLVIAGRDSTQNEILIKKYLEENDLVLHADIQGSPFTIIKNGKDASEQDIWEAAQLTLCHSKAWQLKIVTEVYYVLPGQVSKKAPSGEYIAKGGFMIYGKKNYIKNLELRYAVGVQLEPLQIISGPVENVRHKAKYYAVIVPGQKDKDAVSKDIKMFIYNAAKEADKDLIKNISIEEIKKHAIQNSIVFGLVG